MGGTALAWIGRGSREGRGARGGRATAGLSVRGDDMQGADYPRTPAAQSVPHIVAPMDLVFPHTFVPWFRSVAPHIHAYRGKTFVVGITGEMVAAGRLSAFAQDMSILHAMGVHIVLVHGF